MRTKLHQASVFGALSLAWLVWVTFESYTAVDANRYLELGYGFLAALTVRDQFLNRLPILLIGAPLTYLLLRLCRRPWGLEIVLTTATPLGILALNVWNLNAALASPIPSKLFRLLVMGLIGAGILAVGLALARALAKFQVTHRLLVRAASILERAGSKFRRSRGLRYVCHPAFAVITLLVTAAALLQPNLRRPAAPEGPSFLIILIDTLRADHIGAYGYPRSTTPHLDEWAQEATVFEAGLAQASWTKPSIASLFTSLFPTVHRTGNGLGDRRHVVDGRLEFRPKPKASPSTSQRLPDALVTAAEVFRNAGYRSAGFVTNALVGKDEGYGQGFETYRTRAMTDEKVTEYGNRWIKRNRDRPFFLYLHYFAPHAAYAPPARYNVFGATRESIPLGDGAVKDSINFTGTRHLETEQVEDMIALYDGEILYTDHVVQAVLENLQELGVSERVVVVLTSDHGEEFLDHGMVWHESIHLYQELTRVPLIVRVPGKMTGQTVGSPVMQIDIAPTMIDLAGLNRPTEMQGQSFAGLFDGAPLSPRPVVSEAIDYGYRQSIRSGPLKLIRNWEDQSTELYDLDVDPHELVDLAPRHEAEVAALLDLLEEHNEINRLRAVEFESDLVPAEGDHLEKLRALGYLE